MALRSPWVYGASLKGDAWNCWIVGGFLVLFGIVRMALPAYSTVLSWCNIVLGIWTFCSPLDRWIYRQQRTIYKQPVCRRNRVRILDRIGKDQRNPKPHS